MRGQGKPLIIPTKQSQLQIARLNSLIVTKEFLKNVPTKSVDTFAINTSANVDNDIVGFINVNAIKLSKNKKETGIAMRSIIHAIPLTLYWTFIKLNNALNFADDKTDFTKFGVEVFKTLYDINYNMILPRYAKKHGLRKEINDMKHNKSDYVNKVTRSLNSAHLAFKWSEKDRNRFLNDEFNKTANFDTQTLNKILLTQCSVNYQVLHKWVNVQDSRLDNFFHYVTHYNYAYLQMVIDAVLTSKSFDKLSMTVLPLFSKIIQVNFKNDGDDTSQKLINVFDTKKVSVEMVDELQEIIEDNDMESTIDLSNMFTLFDKKWKRKFGNDSKFDGRKKRFKSMRAKRQLITLLWYHLFSPSIGYLMLTDMQVFKSNDNIGDFYRVAKNLMRKQSRIIKNELSKAENGILKRLKFMKEIFPVHEMGSNGVYVITPFKVHTGLTKAHLYMVALNYTVQNNIDLTESNQLRQLKTPNGIIEFRSKFNGNSNPFGSLRDVISVSRRRVDVEPIIKRTDDGMTDDVNKLVDQLMRSFKEEEDNLIVRFRNGEIDGEQFDGVMNAINKRRMKLNDSVRDLLRSTSKRNPFKITKVESMNDDTDKIDRFNDGPLDETKLNLNKLDELNETFFDIGKQIRTNLGTRKKSCGCSSKLLNYDKYVHKESKVEDIGKTSKNVYGENDSYRENFGENKNYDDIDGEDVYYTGGFNIDSDSDSDGEPKIKKKYGRNHSGKLRFKKSLIIEDELDVWTIPLKYSDFTDSNDMIDLDKLYEDTNAVVNITDEYTADKEWETISKYLITSMQVDGIIFGMFKRFSDEFSNQLSGDYINRKDETLKEIEKTIEMYMYITIVSILSTDPFQMTDLAESSNNLGTLMKAIEMGVMKKQSTQQLIKDIANSVMENMKDWTQVAKGKLPNNKVSKLVLDTSDNLFTLLMSSDQLKSLDKMQKALDNGSSNEFEDAATNFIGKKLNYKTIEQNHINAVLRIKFNVDNEIKSFTGFMALIAKTVFDSSGKANVKSIANAIASKAKVLILKVWDTYESDYKIKRIGLPKDRSYPGDFPEIIESHIKDFINAIVKGSQLKSEENNFSAAWIKFHTYVNDAVKNKSQSLQLRNDNNQLITDLSTYTNNIRSASKILKIKEPNEKEENQLNQSLRAVKLLSLSIGDYLDYILEAFNDPQVLNATKQTNNKKLPELAFEDITNGLIDNIFVSDGSGKNIITLGINRLNVSYKLIVNALKVHIVRFKPKFKGIISKDFTEAIIKLATDVSEQANEDGFLFDDSSVSLFIKFLGIIVNELIKIDDEPTSKTVKKSIIDIISKIKPVFTEHFRKIVEFKRDLSEQSGTDIENIAKIRIQCKKSAEKVGKLFTEYLDSLKPLVSKVANDFSTKFEQEQFKKVEKNRDDLVMEEIKKENNKRKERKDVIQKEVDVINLTDPDEEDQKRINDLRKKRKKFKKQKEINVDFTETLEFLAKESQLVQNAIDRAEEQAQNIGFRPVTSNNKNGEGEFTIQNFNELLQFIEVGEFKLYSISLIIRAVQSVQSDTKTVSHLKRVFNANKKNLTGNDEENEVQSLIDNIEEQERLQYEDNILIGQRFRRGVRRRRFGGRRRFLRGGGRAWRWLLLGGLAGGLVPWVYRRRVRRRPIYRDGIYYYENLPTKGSLRKGFSSGESHRIGWQQRVNELIENNEIFQEFIEEAELENVSIPNVLKAFVLMFMVTSNENDLDDELESIGLTDDEVEGVLDYRMEYILSMDEETKKIRSEPLESDLTDSKNWIGVFDIYDRSGEFKNNPIHMDSDDVLNKTFKNVDGENRSLYKLMIAQLINAPTIFTALKWKSPTSNELKEYRSSIIEDDTYKIFQDTQLDQVKTFDN